MSLYELIAWGMRDRFIDFRSEYQKIESIIEKQKREEEQMARIQCKARASADDLAHIYYAPERIVRLRAAGVDLSTI